jgi:myo-inositol-hexaphosphate 3-phosphohydrolase
MAFGTLLVAGIALLLLLWLAQGSTHSNRMAQPSSAQAGQVQRVFTDTIERRTVSNVELLGEVVFATGFVFSDTEVGGLSALSYDPASDTYYALSDDRSTVDPARFYTLDIAIDDGALTDGDVTFQDVITLTDTMDNPFAAGSIDPEGMAFTNDNMLYISSEGDANDTPPIDPSISKFSLTGQQGITLTVPLKFLPTVTVSGTTTITTGIRNNRAFESLTITPNSEYLYVANEQALLQDGPPTDATTTSPVRFIKYDLATGQPVAEYVYIVDPVTGTNGYNGLVELLALDNNGTFLALERSLSFDAGNTIKLYQAFTQGALDVSGEDDIYWEAMDMPFEIDPPVRKELLVTINDLGVNPDNIEGMTFGPQLADGRQTLILVSDNNFHLLQETQFVALALTIEATPAAQPTLETPRFVDEPGADNAGDSDDPAIWLHPTDPSQSLVIVTQKDGGMTVLDLQGQTLQTLLPTPFGNIRYNNVDIVYGFDLGGESVDLAVASDRENDTLAIFRIDPDTRQLTDVTDEGIIETIFGIDDGEATAYGLATYTGIYSGKEYVFVTQADGAQIAQLELQDTMTGTVTAELVRTLTLPVPEGADPADYQSEGIVVDRERGTLFVAVEEQLGIIRYAADPGGSDEPTIVQSIDQDFLQPDIEGLTIYYGSNGTGYLLVSSQGDSTYAVLSREGTQYLGSFIVADHGDIDQANESDGADVLHAALGSAFPSGLLVVQDGANDPQFVAEDEEELENRSTNFKFVPWENVANAFPTPLIIDTTSYDPRNPTPIALPIFLPRVSN